MKSSQDSSKNIQESNESNDINKRILSVLEERILLTKTKVETGTVTLTKNVFIEDELINIPLLEDNFVVDRVAINQYVQTAPNVRYEENKTIIPVIKEVVVIEKKLMLVEELHITKTQTETTFEKNIPLKREEIIVNRTSTTNN